MSKNDDRDERETTESEQGLGRRTLLKGGAAAGGRGRATRCGAPLVSFRRRTR